MAGAPDVVRGGWARTLWMYIWVVPRAQWDLLDVDYQVYVFRLFHRERRTRLIHYTTIPFIFFFSLALLAHVPLYPGAPRFANAALVYAAATALWHLRWCLSRRLIGLWLATAATAFALWIAGTLYVEWVTSLWNPILGIYVFALAETVSHALEPVPPYTTGEGRWMENVEFRRGKLSSKALAGLATPTVFTLVSFLSNPRSLPMVLLRGSSRLFGYQREQTIARFDAIVENEWRTGQPHMHHVPQ